MIGCDSTGPSSEGSQVSVGFKATSTSSSPSLTKATDDSVVVSGSNGTLTIDEIGIIVSEVELEGDADSAEFETERPSFLDLPLNEPDPVQVVTDEVPSGTYEEFQFEVEDVELDDDDDDEEELSQLRAEIDDAGYSNWPESASMVVVGTFTPDDGEDASFTTYFEAEIEVEVDMEDRPFEIGGDGASRNLTVNLDPAQWFRHSDGTVEDLSQDDYETTGEPVEFEAEYEFGDGVTEIEFDD